MATDVIRFSFILSFSIFVSGNEYSLGHLDIIEDSGQTRKLYNGDQIIDSYIRRRSEYNKDGALNIETDGDTSIDKTKILYKIDESIVSNGNISKTNTETNDSFVDETRKYSKNVYRSLDSLNNKQDYLDKEKVKYNTNDNSDGQKTIRYNDDGDKAVEGYGRSRSANYDNYVQRRYYYDLNKALEEDERSNSKFYDATRTTHNYAGNTQYNQNMNGNRYPDYNYNMNSNNYGGGQPAQMNTLNNIDNVNNQIYYPTNVPTNQCSGCGSQYKNSFRDEPYYDYTRTADNKNAAGNLLRQNNQLQPAAYFDLRHAPEIYTKYLEDFNKSYSTLYEYLCRYEVFKNTLGEINNYRETDASKVYGLNYVSDWSDEDFSKMFMSDLLIQNKQLKYYLR